MSDRLRSIHPDLIAHVFNYDGVNVVVGKIPRFEPQDVDVSARVTRRTTLQRPMIGSPMDTVTEARMAILLAKLGGIGVIHQNLPIDKQVAEVRKVKRWEAGFVTDPEVLGPRATVADVVKGEQQFGFSSYPITRSGKLNSPIIGLVTKRDVRRMLRHPEAWGTPVTEVMTPRERLVTARKEETLDIGDISRANHLIDAHGVDIIPILDRRGHVAAVVTWSDIQKNIDFPLATKGANHQLKVWAAVGSRPESAFPRVEALVAAGADAIVIDARNLFGGYESIARYIKSKNSEVDVVVGNIIHPNVLREALEESGRFLDAFKMFIGTGDICTTSQGIGPGRANGTATYDLDQAYQEFGGDNRFGYIGFIADGGMKFAKHFIVGGALMRNFGGVMMGSWLGRFDESPAQKIQVSEGTYVKRVRGMGSSEAIQDRAGRDRYAQGRTPANLRYAEGIVREVPAVGEGEPEILRFFEGVKTGMHAVGARNLAELYENAILEPVSDMASKGTL